MAIFSRCPLIWGSISKTINIFWNFLCSTYWLQSIRKQFSRNFCLLVYLQSYNEKSKFLFLQTVELSRNTSYKPFLRKILAIIFLYTSKTTPWKNYFRFWKWNLKRTPQSTPNLLSRKLNLKCFTLHST